MENTVAGGGAAAAAEADPGSTKARLDGILESFQAFDSDMKTGTRVRREQDEHRIAQLTAELTRLEKTLSQEIKRRVEMNKSVQVVRKANRCYVSKRCTCVCVRGRGITAYNSIWLLLTAVPGISEFAQKYFLL